MLQMWKNNHSPEMNVFIVKHSAMDARSLATLFTSVRRSVHRKPRDEKVRKVGRRRKGNLVESGVSLSFCAGGQWGFSAGHFYFFS